MRVAPGPEKYCARIHWLVLLVMALALQGVARAPGRTKTPLNAQLLAALQDLAAGEPCSW